MQLEGLGPSRIISIKANISDTAKRQRARCVWPIRSVKLTTWNRNLKSKKRPRCLCVAARIQKQDSIMVNAVRNHLDGREESMKKAAVFGIFAFLLAVSVASAASMIKPADSDKDFCFGYAICE